MRIGRVITRNFRILRAVNAHLGSRLNVLYGENGAGKSSFLEVVSMLSRGRISGGSARQCCGPHQSTWSIDAEIVAADGEDSDSAARRQLGMRWRGDIELEIDRMSGTARDMTRALMVATLGPRNQLFFDDGPQQRRRFIDWALFHVEPEFAQIWSNWQRVLKQRNEALTTGQGVAEIETWNRSLVTAALKVDKLRSDHVAEIARRASVVVANLLDDDVSVRYERGWRSDQEYEAALIELLEKDLRLGHTTAGPQRADLKVEVRGRKGAELSRGQQKLLLAGLLLAASKHVAEQTGSHPVLCIDDFAAELATTAQRRLACQVADYGGQVLLSQHDFNQVLWSEWNPTVFHVEHGAVHPAVQ